MMKKKLEILMRSQFYVGHTKLLFPGITENLEIFIIYNPYCLCGLTTSARGRTGFRGTGNFSGQEFLFLILKHTQLSIHLE